MNIKSFKTLLHNISTILSHSTPKYIGLKPMCNVILFFQHTPYHVLGTNIPLNYWRDKKTKVQAVNQVILTGKQKKGATNRMNTVY